MQKVFTIEGSDGKLAKTIVENSKDKSRGILVLNSLQSVTDKNVEEGLSYLSVMEENLEQLKQALQ